MRRFGLLLFLFIIPGLAFAEPAWTAISGVSSSPQASEAMKGAGLGLNDTLRSVAQLQGLRVSETQVDLFGRDLESPSTLIGGYVERTRCRGKIESRCAVFVRWEIYDLRARMVVRASTEPGRGLGASEVEALQGAIALSLNNALENSRFRSGLPSDRALPGVSFLESIPLPICTPVSAILPLDVETLLPTVVLLRSRGRIGSGVIVSPDGHVLTAAHVVADEATVEVELRSGLTLEGRVLHVDQGYDAAILELPGDGYSCRRLAAAEARPGEELYVMGASLGSDLGWSLSRGIVSAMRDQDGRVFLQTDASINPGNSGGPLFSSHGEVSAITSFKLMGWGVEGIGFGIPVSTMQRRLALQSGASTPQGKPPGEPSYAWAFEDATQIYRSSSSEDPEESPESEETQP